MVNQLFVKYYNSNTLYLRLMPKYQNLYQTVKKSKNTCLAHARSYDDLMIMELQPQQIKMLLDNDRSLKKLSKNKRERFDLPLTHNITKNRLNQQNISDDLTVLLQRSVQKQELLMKKNLFDPYKYFGSSSHINSIQQSTRHHQSRLDAMLSYSDYNSPQNTEHNLSQTKRAKNQKQQMNSKKPQRIRINISSKNSLSSKTNQYAKQSNESGNNQKSILMQKRQFQNRQTKINQAQNKKIQSMKACIFSPQRLIAVVDNKKSQEYKKVQKQSEYLSIKKSIGQPISTYRVGVGKSPKSCVKQNKQNYLKMNINNIQKVRLKLKLSKH